MENANGASGDIIMQDLTKKYGDDDTYVVGYYAHTDVEFTYYISLIVDREEIAIVPVEIRASEEARAFEFSKSAVELWADENGFNGVDYDIRFSFVPIRADGSFDYGITFTDDSVPQTITDKATFTDVFTAGERKTYEITPTETEVWAFACIFFGDMEGRLYDAEGNELYYSASQLYQRFYISYELQAGQTYVLKRAFAVGAFRRTRRK